MSAAERRALLLLLSLGLVGQGVRWWLARPGEAPGDVQLLAALPPRSPAAHRDSVRALLRPLGPTERIDADRATPADLARLPRVGLALAKRIVADREANGPFGGPAGLDRVSGIGPGLLAALGPHLAFSGHSSGPAPLPITPSQPGAPAQNAPAEPVDLNAADVASLDALPGVGPARALAVVRYRAANGPFRAVQDLARVPGFGPAALNRLRDRVRVGDR
ncbi:MAG TPA: helix-hairpin-helix domain-containing protein [Gemmatimonadales bacterium]|nr:helix-hairpin-helix domain-containing protein [Gemmatimonadales bacterium]